jgi:hypothetical protein
MILSDLKKTLHSLNKVNFQLEDGILIPEHFHITEIGIISKVFIDCGGTKRNEKVINFQGEPFYGEARRHPRGATWSTVASTAE